MTYWRDSRGMRGGLRGGPVAVLVALAAVIALPGELSAQSGDLGALLDRVQRIERDIRTLNLQFSRGGKVPARATAGAPAALAPGGAATPALARLDVRLTALEDELRGATGRTENLTFLINQLTQRFDKLVGDVNYRLSLLENGRGGTMPAGTASRTTAAPSPPSVQKVVPGSAAQGFAREPSTLGTLGQNQLSRFTPPEGAADAVSGGGAVAPAGQPRELSPRQTAALPAPAKVLPEGTPKEQFKYAFGLLRRFKYTGAEAALSEFLDANGDHPLAVNARYWLGKTYLARAESGDYAKAAQVFLEGYQKDPKSAKAPDTLLGLGAALMRLDKKVEACAAFDKLKMDFPDSAPAKGNALATERRKGGCK